MLPSNTIPGLIRKPLQQTTRSVRTLTAGSIKLEQYYHNTTYHSNTIVCVNFVSYILF